MRLVKFNNGFPQTSSMLNHLWANDFFNESNTRNCDTPKVNIEEMEDAFAIEVAAPGYNKKDFNVEVDNDRLTISASCEEKKEKHQYSHYEFGYGSFQRSFVLPKDAVNESKISAKYENGILNIRLPKKDEAKVKPKRMINIF
ncbi:MULTISPECIES: Hsp20/alpha crystallin family protein [unclassified Carboxylicivirga]|uniref:Hsp20/alpha crystallin family protein n=1 Tax=Carboxylicivirga TaxID=1628153 RepID=UPI003D335AC5